VTSEPRAGEPAGPIIRTIREALDAAGSRPDEGQRAEKRDFAQKFSNALATCVANALRPHFPGITPDPDGRRQERRARTSKGFKKLDVNYSTVDLGLALGVSIKTITAPDAASGRFTKNYSRIDSELRAEATDYHQRQPYSVLVAVLFLPIEACDDGDRGRGEEGGVSSFGAAVRYFRNRAHRELPRDDIDLFEHFFVALYEHADPIRRGEAMFFDVMASPPKDRRPTSSETYTLSGFVNEVVRTYNARNDPPFEWAP
jgi:hypothetical protein